MTLRSILGLYNYDTKSGSCVFNARNYSIIATSKAINIILSMAKAIEKLIIIKQKQS